MPEHDLPLTKHPGYSDTVDRFRDDPTSGFAGAAREPQATRIAQPKAGDFRGEGWFLANAVALLGAFILVVGWLIS